MSDEQPQPPAPAQVQQRFSLKSIRLLLAAAILPAVLLISFYVYSTVQTTKQRKAELTPQGVQIMAHASQVVAYHLGRKLEPGDPENATSATLLHYGINEQSAVKDSYYGMRLRKALFARDNLTHIADDPTSAIQPDLAYQITGTQSDKMLVVLINQKNKFARCVLTDDTSTSLASSDNQLNHIGADALHFLEAEVFPNSAPLGIDE